MVAGCDLHIHSALSPCADDDMTPANIVGYAKLGGLDVIAVADHNAIGNVRTAMLVGEAYGVCVVPAMELQTAEDIHILCLFATFDGLQNFFDHIDFPDIPNRPDIFGNQLIVDEDDNVVGIEPRLLHIGANIAVEDVPALAELYGGVAVAAHVDREENGMVAVLGKVTDDYRAVELSSHATDEHRRLYADKIVITDSDAHWLDRIGHKSGTLDLPELTPAAVVQVLRGGNTGDL